MEVAISIPNETFQQAEELAQRLGLARNELYAQALEQWIKTQRDAEITRRLNEVYAHEDSSLDPVLMQMQMTALEPEEW
jgi:metal-responsive CopG/Arc/MetJ family transcriptional regulator